MIKSHFLCPAVKGKNSFIYLFIYFRTPITTVNCSSMLFMMWPGKVTHLYGNFRLNAWRKKESKAWIWSITESKHFRKKERDKLYFIRQEANVIRLKFVLFEEVLTWIPKELTSKLKKKINNYDTSKRSISDHGDLYARNRKTLAIEIGKIQKK